MNMIRFISSRLHSYLLILGLTVLVGNNIQKSFTIPNVHHTTEKYCDYNFQSYSPFQTTDYYSGSSSTTNNSSQWTDNIQSIFFHSIRLDDTNNDSFVVETQQQQQQQHDSLFCQKLLHVDDVMLSHNTYVHRMNHSRPFFMCNAPKTGCTLWKTFILFVNDNIRINPRKAQTRRAFLYKRYGKESSQHNMDVILQELKTIVEDHSYFTSTKQIVAAQKIDEWIQKFQLYDHLIIARNPYVRFMSSYLDWLGRANTTEELTPFPKFVRMYRNGAINNTFFPSFKMARMDHIDSVSKFCNFAALHKPTFANLTHVRHPSLVPNYQVLRVEEQPLWYDQLLHNFQLDDLMKEYTDHGNVLFNADPAMTALAHNQAITKDNDSIQLHRLIQTVTGRKAWPGKALTTTRDRHSSDVMFKYYTPEIAKVVTLLFLDDFQNFQYPLWDGNPKTFRLL